MEWKLNGGLNKEGRSRNRVIFLTLKRKRVQSATELLDCPLLPAIKSAVSSLRRPIFRSFSALDFMTTKSHHSPNSTPFLQPFYNSPISLHILLPFPYPSHLSLSLSLSLTFCDSSIFLSTFFKLMAMGMAKLIQMGSLSFVLSFLSFIFFFFFQICPNFLQFLILFVLVFLWVSFLFLVFLDSMRGGVSGGSGSSTPSWDLY